MPVISYIESNDYAMLADGCYVVSLWLDPQVMQLTEAATEDHGAQILSP